MYQAKNMSTIKSSMKQFVTLTISTHCLTSHRHILNTLTHCIMLESFWDCKVTIETQMDWFKGLFTFIKWLVVTTLWSLLRKMCWRNKLFTMFTVRVCLWQSSNSWIFWVRRVVLGLLLSTISYYWKLTPTTQLLAYYVWIITRFQPVNHNSWSILSLTILITLVTRPKVFTWCPTSFTLLPLLNFLYKIDRLKTSLIWSSNKTTLLIWSFSLNKTGNRHLFFPQNKPSSNKAVEYLF